MTRTLTNDTDSPPAPDRAVSAYLFRVFSCDRPLLPPARHSLTGLVEVVVARGEFSVVRQGKKLLLSVPDARVSDPHARLRHLAGSWGIEDLKSRNGTVVGGEPVRWTILKDGDWIECGRTFFRYRAALPALSGGAPDAEPAGSTTELRTISPSFAQELERFAKVAASKVPLVLAGETGTGKEVFAPAAHALSGRRGAFVGVNCAALPATLVEGELFGHRRGAFSGATEDRPGLLRSADGGAARRDRRLPLAACSRNVPLDPDMFHGLVRIAWTGSSVVLRVRADAGRKVFP